MIIRFKLLLLVTGLFCAATPMRAQLKIFVPKETKDTAYLYSYFNNITLRTFLVKKYATFRIGGIKENNNRSLNFYSNSPIGIGIGGVYKIYNFNLSYGIPVNSLYEEKLGKSRAWDFQTSFYSKQWIYDVALQFYKGYYTPNYDDIVSSPYIVRPELRNNTVGFTAHYLFNHNGFSYRAFRVNDEWQHKSSGTFMLSATLLANDLYDMDKVGFVPSELSNGVPNHSAYRKRSLQIGPGMGYAYNYVYRRNWFMLLSFNGRLVYDWGKEDILNEKSQYPNGFKVAYTALGAIGYQNKYWGVNFSSMYSTTDYHSSAQLTNYTANTGFFKLNALYRIQHNNFTRKVVRPFDYLLRK